MSDTCEACKGAGFHVHWESKTPIPPGFCCIQRCDACEKYENDYAAAKAVATSVIERTNEVIGMQKGLRKYTHGGKIFKAHRECASSFKEDRRAGLIYGPFEDKNGGLYQCAEDMSMDMGCCVYCRSTRSST
jgi:hypothetical protein